LQATEVLIVPREIRHVLFQPEEVRTAIMAFLGQANWTKRVLKVGSIDLGQDAMGAFASVAIQTPTGPKSVIVPASDLLVAILLFCKQVRIPLPMISTKSLRMDDGTLVLDIFKDDPAKSDITAQLDLRAADMAARASSLNAMRARSTEAEAALPSPAPSGR
jgi:hypothetical protein